MASVLITGVSTGIGEETARRLVARGDRVFGTVRRKGDGDRLRQQLGERLVPLVVDVRDATAIDQAVERIDEALGNENLLGLVNNAGVAIQGPSLHQPMAEIRDTFDINFFAPIYLVQKTARLLGIDRSRSGPPGRIVNISSVSGGVAAPFLSAYSASKHALEAYSDSLRRELIIYGIEVSIIGPGVVKTAIWEKADAHDTGPYDATPFSAPLKAFQDDLFTKGRDGADPGSIADAIIDALTARNPKARYTVVKGEFFDWTLPRLLPRRTLDRLMASKFGLHPAPRN